MRQGKGWPRLLFNSCQPDFGEAFFIEIIIIGKTSVKTA